MSANVFILEPKPDIAPQAAAQDCSSRRKLGSAYTRICYLILFSELLIAAGLRLLHLGDKSLWVDECASVFFAQQHWADFWRTMWHSEANMLSYYLLLRGWIHLGNTEFTVRILSVIPALLTVPCIYALGARLFSARTGLIAALLLSLNACHIAYSQEARSYSLLLLCCTVSTLCFVNAIERSTVRNWSIYVLISVIGVYTHFFSGLLMLAQWLSIAFLPRPMVHWRKLLASASAIGILIFPSLWFMFTRDVGQIDFIPHPGLRELYHLALFLASDGGKAVGALLTIIYLAGIAIALCNFAALRTDKPSPERWRFILILNCLWAPIALDLCISHLGKEIFYYRYLLICLPAFVLLAAYGFSCIPSRAWHALTLTATAAVSLAAVALYYSRPKDNWREATRYLVSNTHAGETVILYPAYAELPFSYYQERFKPASVAFNNRPQLSNRISLAADPDHSDAVWLLSSRNDDNAASMRQALSDRYQFHDELTYAEGIRLVRYFNRHPSNLAGGTVQTRDAGLFSYFIEGEAQQHE